MQRVNPSDTRGDVTVPEVVTYAPTLQVSPAVGLGRCVLEGDVTLIAPPPDIDGARLELWLFAGASDRNLSFGDSIGLGFNGAPQPYVIDAGTTYVLKLRYSGPQGLWSLDGLIDSF